MMSPNQDQPASMSANQLCPHPTPLDCRKNDLLLSHLHKCEIIGCQLCVNIQVLTAFHLKACRRCTNPKGCSRDMNDVDNKEVDNDDNDNNAEDATKGMTMWWELC